MHLQNQSKDCTNIVQNIYKSPYLLRKNWFNYGALLVQMVVSPWVYGMSVGYTIISISSIKKNKEMLNEKYSSLMRLNIVSIVVSIIGMIISGMLII